MKANNVVTKSTKCFDGNKSIKIDTYEVQCGACNGVFAIEKLFLTGQVHLSCPYCKVDVQLPVAHEGELILDHEIHA